MTVRGLERKTMINENQGFKMPSVITFVTLLLLTLASGTLNAAQFVLSVEDSDGTPVSGFRYLLQADTTYDVDPFNPANTADELLSLSFHKSFHPIGQTQNTASGLSGNTDNSSINVTSVPPGRYYVSVLPYAGYSISGASVEVLPNSQDPNQSLDNLTVTVQAHPIPTAQISIFLFHDNFPINGAPDLPEEANPAVGQPGHVDWTKFSLFLEEPAGRYGMAGGQVIQDAFANPLGTRYLDNCDINGLPDIEPFTNHICFENGAPMVETLGDGTLRPNAEGVLQVKNIAPGKYGVVIIPPAKQQGETHGWMQTSTIEGSKVIDAWVKANEPPAFVEFGPPGPHVFVGFVKSTDEGGFPAFDPPPAGQQVATVSGTVVDIHLSRSPLTQFWPGRPFPGCWIGLNDMTAGGGAGVFATPCDGDSNFSIPDVPPGDYQLVVWDANKDVVISLQPLTVDPNNGTCNGGASCALGDVGVRNWFTRINAGVFNDEDLDGFWDSNEAGIGPESQDVSLRWRDGTLYQNFPTDNEGLAPFDEVFPFFHWLVAEVSFANKKATGATFVVDAGGEVNTNNTQFPDYGELVPQVQADGALYRTETGQVLTAGVQGFLGQTSVMQFGKTDYVTYTDPIFPPPASGPIQFVGENGGISGIVYYATTRAENEPQFAAAEEWEPGVPRVQLALYADGDIDCFPQGNFPNDDCDIDWDNDGTLDADDGLVDDVNGSDGIDYADVDNYPFGNFPGLEDVDYNGNSIFDMGDAIQITYTDSWDDSLPTECPGDNNGNGAAIIDPPVDADRCFDGLRNFNQIRPAVFDGGFAFNEYDTASLPVPIQTKLTAFYSNRIGLVGNSSAGIPRLPDEWILPGDYIVEMATPPGYEQLREEHKNVDFGDEYKPNEDQDAASATAMALPPACVGDTHTVPQYLTMVTKDGTGTDPGNGSNLVDAALLNDEGVFAPFAGETRVLCDRKQVPLSAGQNAAAEFFLMTHVPKAANISGIALNDLANEFNAASPSFGEKYAPPHIPIAFYDWNGNEVNRIYSDRWGRFNAMVPSTFTANLPMPSGMSPNMLISCMNDAGPITNPDYDPALDTDGDGIDSNGESAKIVDPFFDAQYSQFCYTFQYMPGVITYLDTPVVPIAAFAAEGQYPLDCEASTNTPMISSVTRVGGAGGGPFALPGQQIRINSMGSNAVVPNPEWDGIDHANRTITRDYSFQAGTLAYLVEILPNGFGTRTPLLNQVVDQAGNYLVGDISPIMAAGDYQLMVSNGSVESPIGVTFTVGVDDNGTERGLRPNGSFYDVYRIPEDFASIQEAIGNPTLGQPGVAAGDMILVGPGTYEEMVIMWKPVKLQGWGAGAVTVNARQTPTEKIIAWRELSSQLVDAAMIDQLPGQTNAPFGFAGLVGGTFPTEEGAGVFIAGLRSGPTRFGHPANRGARVDGLTVIGASAGGGIIANGYNQYLNITNNRLTGNAGFNGGAIRLGHPDLTHIIANRRDPSYVAGNDNLAVGTLVYDDSRIDRARIHHNMVIKNGGLNGSGGGISLYTGADAYRVQNNWICGNFSQGNGGGIAHLGLSRNGIIEDNTIIFNETFRQTPGSAPAGGGIYIAGQPGITPEAETGLMLSPGSGNVTVDSNLIRGNLAGAGDGGGIRVERVNGQDMPESRFYINDQGEEAEGPWVRGEWYFVNLLNNMINNNVAGVAGGGISFQDAPRMSVRNNTVANNDSTSTGSQAFATNSPNQSTPLPAGIVSRLHSAEMAQLMVLVEESYEDGDPVPGANGLNATYTNPNLRDNIIYHNRSFFWTNYDVAGTQENVLVPVTCLTPTNPGSDVTCDIASYEPTFYDAVSRDLGVLDGIVLTGDLLNPMFSLLLDTLQTTYHSSNTYTSGDPGFVNGYFNDGRENTLLFNEPVGLATAAALDEGGNFIQVSYGPLSLVQPDDVVGNAEGPLFDYHLGAGSPALNEGGNTPSSGRLSVDFDNDTRPTSSQSDIGADER
ncbi:MAG: right-handed parallel beta-helix repeat-containing protein [Candidatus Thiodiazotropha sp.]